jgi:hypothetical protein
MRSEAAITCWLVRMKPVGSTTKLVLRPAAGRARRALLGIRPCLHHGDGHHCGFKRSTMWQTGPDGGRAGRWRLTHHPASGEEAEQAGQRRQHERGAGRARHDAHSRLAQKGAEAGLSRTRTPNWSPCRAWPGSVPATTAQVFFETARSPPATRLDGGLGLIGSGTLGPVRTNCMPWGAWDAARLFFGPRLASRSLATRSRFAGWRNQS